LARNEAFVVAKPYGRFGCVLIIREKTILQKRELRRDQIRSPSYSLLAKSDVTSREISILVLTLEIIKAIFELCKYLGM